MTGNPVPAGPGPAVTVVVPVHNGGRHAVEAIDSLLAQTYHPLEILVVNDGSPLDEDRGLRERFGERIRYVEKANTGLSDTLNQAIFGLVDTELFARLDQDDLAEPDRIALQVELLRESGATACLTRFWRVGDNGARLSIHPLDRADHFPYDPDPDRHGQIVHSTLLVRTDTLRLLGGYDAAFYPADDFELSLRLHEHGPVVVHGRPLVRYRVHDGAGSFSHFRRMVLTTRYLEARLLEGADVVGGLDEWERAHPVGRIERIGYRGRYWYRRAGAAIGDGRNVHGAAFMLLAGVLNARHVGRRLRGAVSAQLSIRSTSPRRQS